MLLVEENILYLLVNVVLHSEIFKGNKFIRSLKDWFGEVGQNPGDKVWMHVETDHIW